MFVTLGNKPSGCNGTLPNSAFAEIVPQRPTSISDLDAALAAITGNWRDPMNTRKILIGTGVAAADRLVEVVNEWRAAASS